jgi:hypothetical protein
MPLSEENLKSLPKAVDKRLWGKNRVPRRVKVHITEANILPQVQIQAKQV